MRDGSEPSTDRGTTGTRRLVLNPASGGGDHVDRVRRLAADYGFPVEETDGPGHATELAEAAAADGVDRLAVCGGDGTVHEVVRGLVRADALDAVTLCVVPAGTANVVAGEIGVSSLEDGFDVAENGETRRIDLGTAGGEPFVMSAIGGMPADASAAATQELKRRFGPFAFVVGAVREGLSFDGVRVDVVSEGEDARWRGEALAVLAGNLRRFAAAGGGANAEDGLLEVAIVERMPSGELVAEAVEGLLLGRDPPHVAELAASRLAVHSVDGEPVTFSLDGEIRAFDDVEIGVLPRALRLRVGAAYDPGPDADGRDR